MKAAVLRGKHLVSIDEFPEPPFEENCVKVETAYCGLCGSDFHKYEGRSGSRPLKLPVPLGHEVSGIVAEVGSKVTGFKKGDRVTVDPNWSCGKCWYCKQGIRHMCENSRGVVKGFADYICPPEENVYHIPDTLSLRDASLAEPLSCCLHGVDLLDIQLGDTVAIVGMGAIGAMMVQLCRMQSAAEIIVIETVEEKREKAFELGATRFVNPIKTDPTIAIRDMGIKNVDKVMECVGIPATVSTALNVAGKCATVVMFGLGDPAKEYKFNQYEVISKELTIKSSFLNPHTMGRSIDLLEKGVLDVDNIISKELTAEELIQELQDRKWSNWGKVIVKWKDFE